MSTLRNTTENAVYIFAKKQFIFIVCVFKRLTMKQNNLFITHTAVS